MAQKPSTLQPKNKVLPVVATLLVAVVMGLFFAKPINLVSSDLGRHITNGELVLNGVWDVLYTNHYSFTEPTHPFINHHWGSGVIFYFIHQAFGFEGLTMLNILLMLGSLGFLVATLSSRVPRGIVLTAILVFGPLMASRTEVRPESFSSLFLMAYLWQLSRFSEDRSSGRALFLTLLPLQLLWVNLHIFFILGVGAVGTYLLASLVNNNRAHTRTLGMLLLGLVAVSLINPFHIHGLLAPFSIFTAYGYMVYENQSAWFIYNRFGSSVAMYFFVTAAISLACIGYLIRTKNWTQHLPFILLTLVFMALSFKAIRGFALFGLLAGLLASVTMHQMIEAAAFAARNRALALLRLLPIGLSIIGLAWTDTFATPLATYKETNQKKPGKQKTVVANTLGLYKGLDGSAKFFKKAGMHGPIFNNYDIGSFLVYALDGREKVFVDNRPEAYSVAFFDSIYGPMQRDEQVWKAMAAKYAINAIWFYRLDETEFAQPFLIRRTQDPEWVPVYVDDVALVLVRNVAENAAVIKSNGLPRTMFSGVPN